MSVLKLIKQFLENHMDAEFKYILQAAVENLYSQKTPHVRNCDIYETTASTICDILDDRNVAVDAAYRNYISDAACTAFHSVNSDEIGPLALSALIAEAIMIQVAQIQLKFLPKPDNEDRHFNPFASDDGFCNPLKLKLAD
jgi:hypothetical protein